MHREHDTIHDHRAAAEGELVTDPVCGMRVDPATSRHRLEVDGESFHFCSGSCLAKFEAEPLRYRSGPPETTTPASDGEALHTCPMHPEIRQRGPGSCPQCGMALC